MNMFVKLLLLITIAIVLGELLVANVNGKTGPVVGAKHEPAPTSQKKNGPVVGAKDEPAPTSQKKNPALPATKAKKKGGKTKPKQNATSEKHKPPTPNNLTQSIIKDDQIFIAIQHSSDMNNASKTAGARQMKTGKK